MFIDIIMLYFRFVYVALMTCYSNTTTILLQRNKNNLNYKKVMKKRGLCLLGLISSLHLISPIFPLAAADVRFIDYEELSESSNLKKVVGTVKDEYGDPVIGANIKCDKTGLGTITDVNGNFELNVPIGNSIVISYLGYLQQEITVKNSGKKLDIVLHENVQELNDVVVVGYGKTSSKDITSSIASLSEKEFNKGPVNSVAQMIQGKVAGVYISNDGDPNSEGSLIIRGTSTLRTGAQEPLYVIDGVPGAGMVAPEDIVSIDILKDASATAIYGSRAANGVVMITTRNAKGGKQKYTTVSAYTSIEQVSNRYEMMTGDTYRNYISSNGSAVETGWDDNVNMDWQDELMRTALTQNYYFNTGGSFESTRYDASVTYRKQDGIIRTTGQEKAIMRANVEQSLLNDKVIVGATISGELLNQDLLYSPSSVYKSMLTFVPTTLATDEDGNYKEDIDRRDPNPIALLDQNQKNASSRTLFGSFRAKWQILPNLVFNTSYSYQNKQVNTNSYADKDSKLALGQNGQAIRSAYEDTEKIFENYLSFDDTFKGHKVGAMLGYSWQENTTGNGFQTSNVNFISDETAYENMGLGSAPEGYNVDYGSTTVRTLRMISFFGRLKYNYKDRYLLQVSLRNDGSSAFGKNNRWGWFPSVSGAWRVISEDFMRNQSIFNDLKLKVGYGVSGNSIGFDPMVSSVLYGKVGKSYYQGSYINSIGVVQNENPDLKWEKTEMFNVGLDMAFLDSRLRIGAEWYSKRTSDLIWEYDVPTTQYLYDKMVANVGVITNKGIELTISGDIIQTKDFSWSSGVTLSHNKNMVKSLSNDLFKVDYVLTGTGAIGAGQSGGSAQIIKEGYPLGTFYTLKFAGFSEDGKSLFYNHDGEKTDSPVAPDDYFECGNSQPKLNYSWSNTLTWRNFTLDLLFRGVAGQKVLNATLAGLTYTSRVSHYNQPMYVIESNQPFNDTRSHFVSDRYIEKADFLRLENINLTYNVPLKENKFVKGVDIYFNVNNAFVITSYKGIDPEVGMGGIEPGIDANNLYPKTRSYQLGLKLNF